MLGSLGTVRVTPVDRGLGMGLGPWSEDISVPQLLSAMILWE